VDLIAFEQVGVALLLGLLVGFERERAGHEIAGIRTFALITVFGAIAALLARVYGDWVIAAGVIGVAAMMVLENVGRMESGEAHPGLTTEVAALVMYGLGALIVGGSMSLAVAIGGAVAILLYWKKPLHEFVRGLEEQDVRAISRLVLIGLVVLPVLPDKTYGPYDVLNPFRIWLMVVLIVGISLGGYIIRKFLGEKAGMILGGVLGGLISSTATTVSFARRSRNAPSVSPAAATVIMIASTIVFVRVAFEVAVVAPGILWQVIPPLAAMAGAMAIIAAVSYFFSGGRSQEIPKPEDPAELKAAVIFGLLYAIVLFAVAAAKENFGDQGLYFVAALSGLTDMDAITLSTAQMIEAERVPVDTGWRMMLVGALCNNAFKVGAVAVLGHRRLLRRTGILFGIALVCGILILAFWP